MRCGRHPWPPPCGPPLRQPSATECAPAMSVTMSRTCPCPRLDPSSPAALAPPLASELWPAGHGVPPRAVPSPASQLPPSYPYPPDPIWTAQIRFGRTGQPKSTKPSHPPRHCPISTTCAKTKSTGQHPVSPSLLQKSPCSFW